jgi:hypothetical protein
MQLPNNIKYRNIVIHLLADDYLLSKPCRPRPSSGHGTYFYTLYNNLNSTEFGYMLQSMHISS